MRKFKKGDLIRLVKGTSTNSVFVPCSRLIIDVSYDQYKLQAIDDIESVPKGSIYWFNCYEIDINSEIVPLPNDILKGML